MVRDANIRRLREAIDRIGEVISLRDPLTTHEVQLTHPQMHTLMLLGRGISTINELKRRLHATGPTLTGIVDRLERMRLVVRKRDAKDRRVVRLDVTQAGKKCQQGCEQMVARRLGMLLGLLDSDDQEALVSIFERLAVRASAHTAGRDESRAGKDKSHAS